MSAVNVLVLDGESSFATKVVRSLGAAGRWRIHVLAKSVQKRRPTLAWSRHVRSLHLAGIDGDDHSYLETLRGVAKETKAELILPIVESTSLFCIRHREALENIASVAPLSSAESFVTATDKGLLAAFLHEHGIPHPRTCLPDDLILSTFRYPLLVKPRRASGGRGFTKVESSEELHRELESRSDRADVCLQEYAHGVDMGCSVLARRGQIQAWTTQRGLRRSGPYSPFSELEMEASMPVLEMTAKLMKSLHWTGVAHVDFRIDRHTGQPLVLEVNGRFWASLWASTMANVNFPDLVCRMTLGESLPTVYRRSGRFVHARVLCQDFLRLRARALDVRWSGLSGILDDPVPEILATIRSWHAAIAVPRAAQ